MALYNQSIPLCNFKASRNPTSADDASCGFSVGSLWGRESRIYKCSDSTNGAAVWDLQGSGGGSVITDPTIITTITTNSNYNDSYGNPSPSIGGIFNTTLPVGINEGDYYIEPFATDGMPKHKIECKRNASGNLILIKITYLQ